ncbi:hypothetical protein FRB90_008265 [Tulasnella sp. 427]|nr:hypothetical protein FRB90_008265 [Tulasnella sp. 427]
MIRTCRYLRNLAEPILYRHILLDPDDVFSLPLTSILLHITLSDRKDLLPYVLTYHGPLVAQDVSMQQMAVTTHRAPRRLNLLQRDNSDKPAFTIEERMDMMNTIFSGTVNLRDVHFSDHSYWWPPELWGSFDAFKYWNNLEALELNVWETSPSLVPILRAQPSLTRLSLFGTPNGQRQWDGLQSTDIPRLRSLRASISDAAVLVPGRPIREMELITPLRPYKESLLRHFALSSCDIVDFRMVVAGFWHEETLQSTLYAVNRHVPRIVALSLILDDIVTDHNLLVTLPLFMDLQHLRLISTRESQRIPDNSTPIWNTTARGHVYRGRDFDAFTGELKEACPTLVDIECYRLPYWLVTYFASIDPV